MAFKLIDLICTIIMSLAAIIFFTLLSAGAMNEFEDDKLFPIEESQALKFEFEEFDSESFEVPLPIQNGEAILDISQEKTFNGNIDCQLQKLYYSAKAQVLELPPVSFTDFIFDPLSNLLLLSSDTLRFYHLNTTDWRFGPKDLQKVANGVDPRYLIKTEAAQKMVFVSLDFSKTPNSEFSLIAVMGLGNIVTVVNLEKSETLFSFALDFNITTSTVAKLSEPFSKSKFNIVLYNKGATALWIYRVDLKKTDGEVVSTKADLSFLNPSKDISNSQNRHAATSIDFAIYHQATVEAPVILVLTKELGLFKFIDIDNTGNFQLASDRTQYIFGEQIIVSGKRVFVVSVNEDKETSTIDIFQMDKHDTGLLKYAK